MFKNLIAISIVILLILTTLGGCLERKIEFIGDTDKVEMVEYTIVAEDENKNVIGDSFNYNDGVYAYKINGSVRNTAGERLSRVWVSIKFHDGDDNFLDSKTYLIIDFASNDVKDFSLTFTNDENYFRDISNIYFVYVATRD